MGMGTSTTATTKTKNGFPNNNPKILNQQHPLILTQEKIHTALLISVFGFLL